MDIDGFSQSMPSAEVWKMLWDQPDGTEGLVIGHESKLVDDLLISVERRSVDQECPGVCDGCRKKLRGPYFHCLHCPDFDTCAACFENVLIGHRHEFRLRYWPFSDIPMDGSDLDQLLKLVKKEIPHDTSQTPYIGNLNQQIQLLSDASRNKYLRTEIRRATNWGKLHKLYSRFENCVATLTTKVSVDGIPTPPLVAPFQKMMEKNWDIGNAQETAFFVHLSNFDKVDYSRDVDKKKLGAALQKFVREFMEPSGIDDADDILNSWIDSNELPLTPIDTMDELDGNLARSAITVEGTAQYQWEYLKPRSELDIGKDMRDFQAKVVSIVSKFSKRPDLWSPDGQFAITVSEHSRPAGLEDILNDAKLSRRLGRFEEALTILSSESDMHLEVVFEKFRVFEDMGELRRCMKCVENFHQTMQNSHRDCNSAKSFLLKLCAAYIACFVKGEWQNAMELALLAHRDYLSGRTSCDITTVEIELYYHKIWLAVSRDLGETMVYGESSARLIKLREAVQDANLFPLAYEVLLVELELAKEPQRRPKVPSYWSAREFNDFMDVPATVCERIWSYLEKLSSSGFNGDSPVLEEAHCRLHLAEAFRRAAVTNEHIELEMLFYRQSAIQRKEALAIYRACGCELGMTNIALFDSKRPDQYDIKEDILSECDRICSLFEELGSSRGLQETLLWKAEFLHTYFRDPVKESYSQLEQVAHTSGNMHRWHLAKMKKLQWWMTSTTLVDDCRMVFKEPQGFLSSELGAIASLNLSRAYRAVGDLVQAEISGYFHLLLVSCRDDNDHIYSAWMNLLQIRNNLVLELPRHVRSASYSSWTEGSLQILVNIFARAVELAAMGWRSRTYDIIKVLELILSVPRAGVSFNSNMQPEETGLPPALHVYIPLLDLGMRLVELLPIFFWPVLLDELGLTLAVILESSGNHTLALYTYRQSLLANHPGSKPLANKVKVLAGNLLVRMDYQNPGCYKYAKAAAMKTFMQAEPFLWSNVFTDESFRDAIWTSISLASCLLSVFLEVSSEPGDDRTETFQARFDGLLEACSSAIRRVIGQWQGVRRMLLARSTSDTLRHQRTFLSGKLSNKLLTAQLELAISLAQKEDAGVINLWRVVQQWKAISLSDLLWDSRSYIPQSSAIDDKAKTLIEEEKSLVDKINAAEPYDRPNLRNQLREHWTQMASHPEFTTFSAMKLGMGATLDHLKQIQQISNQIGSENNTVVFVDWARHRDNIIFLSVRCSPTSQTIDYRCLPLTYSAVEEWVLRKMRDISVSFGSQSSRRKRLERADDLAELGPLIDPLRRDLTGEELLVLCPSGVLNQIPIHAIPFSESEDLLIASNPIVYSSSHAITKSCVDMAIQKINSDRPSTKFVAFGRFGDLDPSEDHLIREMVVGLAEKFEGVHVTGKDLKRDKFTTSTADADFIHYHGHATYESDTSIRSLVLQPDPSNGDTGRFVVDDIFQLQLESPHVTLLACASGEQDFSLNDEPFGMVTAFLCAGATSVAATLWPTDSRDARDFCDIFYNQVKDESPVINLAKAMQKAVLTLRKDWDFDDPYHWAQFVLYGSWFCRNVSKQ